MSAQQDEVTFTLPRSDVALLMQVASQALMPYQRLGQVLQSMQAQASAQASGGASQAAQRPNGEAMGMAP